MLALFKARHVRVYKELGSLQCRLWYWKILFFYEILKVSTPKYVFDIIPVSNGNCYNTRAQSKSEFTWLYTKTKSFNSALFPSCIKEWNLLDAKSRNLPSVFRSKKSLLIYFKTDENSIFDVHNPIGIKLLNRLSLTLVT